VTEKIVFAFDEIVGAMQTTHHWGDCHDRMRRWHAPLF
jgi:hypothetical protein